MGTKVFMAVMCLLIVGIGSAAFAQDAEYKRTPQEVRADDLTKNKAIEDSWHGAKNYLGLALGLGLAIAAFGGAFGQSRAIAASVEAVARQPEAGARIQGMMIIGLALIETLVIYMLLICFMWGGKLGA